MLSLNISQLNLAIRPRLFRYVVRSKEMGSSGSTRRITVVNDEPNGVVKISNEVVERLKGELQTDKVEPKETSTKPTAAPSEAPVEERLIEHKEPDEVVYTNEQRTAIFSDLERENRELLQLVGKKLEKYVNEVEEKYFNNSCLPVCEEKETKVLNCYQNNKLRTLKCANEVAEFANCVDAVRQSVLINRE